jgi:AraC-like DNA-binding protein
MTLRSRLPELREVIDELASSHARPCSVAPDIRVFSSSSVTTPLETISEANVALVAQGTKRSLVGDRIFDYSAGQFLAVTVDLPMTSWITEASEEAPFLAVGITLEPGLVAELLLDLPATSPEAKGHAVGEFDAAPELIDAVLRLLRVVQSPSDYRVLGRAIIREIYWRLLTGAEGPMIRDLGRADGELAAVARATAWLRANYDRPFRAEELANVVGLSVSSVNRCFRRATNFSPLQYQKQLRLHQARMHLLSGQDDIGRLGHAVGYASASQFAREYRRLFGRSPRDDARSPSAHG